MAEPSGVGTSLNSFLQERVGRQRVFLGRGWDETFPKANISLVKAFARSFRLDSAVTELLINDSAFDDSAAGELLPYLSGAKCAVSALSVESSTLTWTGGTRIAAAFSLSPCSLSALSLTVRFDRGICVALSKMMQSSLSLKRLCLHSRDGALSNECLVVIGSGVALSTTLATLEISGNVSYGLIGVRGFSQGLKRSESLKRLRLGIYAEDDPLRLDACVPLKDDGFQILLQSIRDARCKLEELSVANHQIVMDSSLPNVLSQTLMQMQTLRNIDFGGNRNFMSSGASILMSAFVTPPSESFLSLSGCVIVPSFVLSQAVEMNHCPVWLDLKNCGLDDIELRDFSSSLQFNENLRILELSGNAISDGGAKLLAEALKSNRSLEVLTLGGNPIGVEGAMNFMELVNGNDMLEGVFLSPLQDSLGGPGHSRLRTRTDRSVTSGFWAQEVIARKTWLNLTRKEVECVLDSEEEKCKWSGRLDRLRWAIDRYLAVAGVPFSVGHALFAQLRALEEQRIAAALDGVQEARPRQKGADSHRSTVGAPSESGEGSLSHAGGARGVAARSSAGASGVAGDPVESRPDASVESIPMHRKLLVMEKINPQERLEKLIYLLNAYLVDDKRAVCTAEHPLLDDALLMMENNVRARAMVGKNRPFLSLLAQCAQRRLEYPSDVSVRVFVLSIFKILLTMGLEVQAPLGAQFEDGVEDSTGLEGVGSSLEERERRQDKFRSELRTIFPFDVDAIDLLLRSAAYQGDAVERQWVRASNEVGVSVSAFKAGFGERRVRLWRRLEAIYGEGYDEPITRASSDTFEVADVAGAAESAVSGSRSVVGMSAYIAELENDLESFAEEKAVLSEELEEQMRVEEERLLNFELPSLSVDVNRGLATEKSRVMTQQRKEKGLTLVSTFSKFFGKPAAKRSVAGGGAGVKGSGPVTVESSVSSSIVTPLTGTGPGTGPAHTESMLSFASSVYPVQAAGTGPGGAFVPERINDDASDNLSGFSDLTDDEEIIPGEDFSQPLVQKLHAEPTSVGNAGEGAAEGAHALDAGVDADTPAVDDNAVATEVDLRADVNIPGLDEGVDVDTPAVRPGGLCLLPVPDLEQREPEPSQPRMFLPVPDFDFDDLQK